MSDSTRLTGAALKSKVIKELRLYLSDYGLPMDDYDVSYYYEHSIGSDMQPIVYVRFTNQLGTCDIEIDSIYVGDMGELDQFSPPQLG